MDEVVTDQEEFDDHDDEYVHEDAVNFETRDEDSESEFDGIDSEDNSLPTLSCYLGKDLITKWEKHPPNKNVRVRAYNIVNHLPGVIGNAKNQTTPLECWQCLIDKNILDLILENTNT